MAAKLTDVAGKTAFITGGGSGIGAGLARCLAKAGMNIVVAGRRESELANTVREVEALGARALACTMDVTLIDQFAAAADRAEDAFGPIHLLCNNAGISISGTSIADTSLNDWDWNLTVNVQGPINGVATFLPRMLKHGEPSHINFTSSAAGLRVPPWPTGAYVTCKYAITGLAEALAIEQAETNIGVSATFPALVQSKIYEASLRRDPKFGGPTAPTGREGAVERFAQGLDPEVLGQRLLHAMQTGAVHIMTHSAVRPGVEARHQQLMAAFDDLDASLASAS